MGCRDRPGSQVHIQQEAGWKRKVGRWQTEAWGCHWPSPCLALICHSRDTYTFSHSIFWHLPSRVSTAMSTSTTTWVAEGLPTRHQPFRQGRVASVGFRQLRGASSDGQKKRKWRR